jgi:hypothetical protein
MSLNVGPGLGVVLREEDPEEIMEMAADHSIIGEKDKVGVGPTFSICLCFAWSIPGPTSTFS